MKRGKIILFTAACLAAQAAAQSPPDLSGRWLVTGVMDQPEGGKPGRGRFDFTIEQVGVDLTGISTQFTSPFSGAKTNPEESKYVIAGRLFLAGNHPPLVFIRRMKPDSDFIALFVGVLSKNGKTVEGHIANNSSGHGWFHMQKE